MARPPFRVPKSKEIRDAVSKSYWTALRKRVVSYKQAMQTFRKAARSA